MNAESRPTISWAALQRDLGESAVRSIFRGRLGLGSKVPAYEKLKVGDVILSRRIRPDFISRNVLAAQSERGHTANNAIWTHSMLYVGALHVVESNKPMKWRTGVQVAPLTDYCQDFELIILRRSDKEFTNYRHHEVVRHGLLSRSIHPRRYDLSTAFAIRLARYGVRPLRGRVLDRIICSEFILECFAIGGGYMIEQYVRIREENTSDYFLPADLACDVNFEKLQMEYYDLVEM